MGFFWTFPSCSHAVLLSTGQIMPLIPLSKDQRQLLSKGQDSISESKVTGKEIRDTELSPAGGPTAQGALSSLVIRCGKETEACVGPNPNMPRGFTLLPSSTLLFWG